jgi:steroid delta-isomerase
VPDQTTGGAEAEALLAAHVARFNAGVESGDWAPMLEGFAADAVLRFEGVPTGPFEGRDAIAAAYAAQPPDDAVEILESHAEGDTLVAVYAWRRNSPSPAGRMILTPRDGRIARLVVTFD